MAGHVDELGHVETTGGPFDLGDERLRERTGSGLYFALLRANGVSLYLEANGEG